MIATCADRVAANTSSEINAEIRRRMEQDLCYFEEHPEEIDQRLRELDREWDIERALETASASISLLGITMGLLRSRVWLFVPLAVQGFFLQHAIQGWCPPLPVLRKMGFRTMQEIDEERVELLAMREQYRERLDAMAASACGGPSNTPTASDVPSERPVDAQSSEPSGI